MDWIAAKNKKTGEIVSICGLSWSSEGTTVYYAGKDSVRHTLELKKFEKSFEQVDLDLSYIVPTIIEGAKVSYEIRQILCPIARKCTPDYYRVGDLVYLCNIDSNAVTYFGDFAKDYNYYREDIVFKIIGIVDSFGLLDDPTDGLKYLELEHHRGPKVEHKDGRTDCRVPIQYRKPFASDASRYLKRFDMPF